MKRQVLFGIYICFLIVAACSTQYDKNVKHCLELAGSNERELLKVIKHYSDPNDSLKRKAALFLIQHMPGHGTIHSSWINSEGEKKEIDILTYENIQTLRQTMDECGYFQVIHPKEEDCQYLTADFLIANIDKAFYNWQNLPHKPQFSFDQFCELLLPYRIGVEKIEEWRNPVINRLGTIVDSMITQLDTLPMPIMIQQLLSSYDYRYDPRAAALPHHQSYSEMMKYRIGTCEDITQLHVLTCRALGIPVSMDFIPMWGNLNGGHARMMYLDFDGKMKIFQDKDNMYKRPAKVFRRVFSSNNELFNILGSSSSIPPMLRDSRFIDTTTDHCTCANVVLQDSEIPDNEKCLFISIFNYGNWHPIYWAPVQKDKPAVFKNMGTDVIYRIGTYYNSRNHFLTAPFLLTKNGKMQYFDGFNKSTDTLHISSNWGTIYLGELSIEENEKYYLSGWNGKWQLLEEATAHYQAVPVVTDGKKQTEKRLVIEFPNAPKESLLRVSNPSVENSARMFIWNGDKVNWY